MFKQCIYTECSKIYIQLLMEIVVHTHQIHHEIRFKVLLHTHTIHTNLTG